MLLPLSNEGKLIVFLVMNPFTPNEGGGGRGGGGRGI